MKSFVRIILAVLAVATVTVASLSVGDGRTHAARGGASEGSPSSDHVVLRPVPSGGPHHDPAANHASQTPKGLPPQSEHAHGRGSGDALVDHKPPPRNPNARHEVETGEGSNGTSTSLMTYHGGAVQAAPNVYLIFWGSSWTGSSGDPYGVANRLHYMYQGLGGSTWANVLKQYGSNYGSFANPTGQYRGWLRDTSTVPASPSQADIAAVARRAASTMGDYSYNAQYVVALPWGRIDQVS